MVNHQFKNMKIGLMSFKDGIALYPDQKGLNKIPIIQTSKQSLNVQDLGIDIWLSDAPLEDLWRTGWMMNCNIKHRDYLCYGFQTLKNMMGKSEDVLQDMYHFYHLILNYAQNIFSHYDIKMGDLIRGISRQQSGIIEPETFAPIYAMMQYPKNQITCLNEKELKDLKDMGYKHYILKKNSLVYHNELLERLQLPDENQYLIVDNPHHQLMRHKPFLFFRSDADYPYYNSIQKGLLRRITYDKRHTYVFREWITWIEYDWHTVAFPMRKVCYFNRYLSKPEIKDRYQIKRFHLSPEQAQSFDKETFALSVLAESYVRSLQNPIVHLDHIADALTVCSSALDKSILLPMVWAVHQLNPIRQQNNYLYSKKRIEHYLPFMVSGFGGNQIDLWVSEQTDLTTLNQLITKQEFNLYSH